MSSIKLESNASGTGIFTIASPNSNTNRTLTIPDATGTINTSGAVNEVPAGSASAPSIYPAGDTNTGIFFPAADTIAFGEGGAEAMRIDSSGNVGIGSTSPSTYVDASTSLVIQASSGRSGLTLVSNQTIANEILGRINFTDSGSTNSSYRNAIIDGVRGSSDNSAYLSFSTSNGGNPAERGRMLSGGSFYWAASDYTVDYPGEGNTATGIYLESSGKVAISRDNTNPLVLNRKTSDGTIISIRQDGTEEGTISVSGTTVSYNGGHLSRWAQMPGTKDDTLLKGTVMSNLDEMNVYTDAEGNPVDNEQLNKVKVSDVEGDVNVAGVFVNWTYDDAHQVDEINMAMTGDMIIRIAQGVVVQKGDLLMSAGDGTAKPQDDDIVRSKTVAKVTSNHVTCTYADGSYCVPCVLMAC